MSSSVTVLLGVGLYLVAFLALLNDQFGVISTPWDKTNENLIVSQFMDKNSRQLIRLDDKCKWSLKPNSSTRIQRKQHYFFQNM
jgi:hypothetical protein